MMTISWKSTFKRHGAHALFRAATILMSLYMIMKRHPRRAILGAGLAVLAAYTIAYLRHPVLPGNSPFPLGWWGWWDQGYYLRSAEALAQGKLTPNAHWYPLGYSLLAAPFTLATSMHAFFFVNLTCFTLTLIVWIRLSRVFGISALWAIVLFVGSLAFDPAILEEFIIPWNTTPVTFYIYLCLFLALRQEGLTRGSIALLSLSAALVPITRPSDTVLLVPIMCAVLYRLAVEHPWQQSLKLILVSAGVLISVFGLYLALHVSIYGWALSPYMTHSGQLGLDVRPLAEKLYAFLVDPAPLYAEGTGMVRRSLWLLIVPYGAFVLIARTGWRGCVIAALIVINFVVYIGYTDLLPHGLWRYHNVHYFKLSFPLLSLCAASALLAALTDRRHLAGIAAAVIAISTVRYEVEETGIASVQVENQNTLNITCTGCVSPRVMIISPTTMSYDHVYFHNNQILADEKKLRNIYEFRTIPVNGTIRAVFPEPVPASSYRMLFAASHGYSKSSPPAVKFIRGYFRIKLPFA